MDDTARILAVLSTGLSVEETAGYLMLDRRRVLAAARWDPKRLRWVNTPPTRKPRRHSRLTPDDKRQVWEAAGWLCAVPSCPSNDPAKPASRREGQWRLTVDHITPLSQGGTDQAANLQSLCWFHNKQKTCLAQAEFQQLLGVTW
jgi:5-methylcytosine-specific restriction endonuclease McrA